LTQTPAHAADGVTAADRARQSCGIEAHRERPDPHERAAKALARAFVEFQHWCARFASPIPL